MAFDFNEDEMVLAGPRENRLPDGVNEPTAEIDFVSVVELNGLPTDFAAYNRILPDDRERAANGAIHVIKGDYDKIEPLSETLVVMSWDNGLSYHLRLPEVLLYMLVANGAAILDIARGPVGMVAKSIAQAAYENKGDEIARLRKNNGVAE